MERAARQYVRMLEEGLACRSEGPRVFSQRDYRLAINWYEAGIPVGMILEILDGRRTGARSLTQIASRVDESWKAVRVGEAGSGGASWFVDDCLHGWNNGI